MMKTSMKEAERKKKNSAMVDVMVIQVLREISDFQVLQDSQDQLEFKGQLAEMVHQESTEETVLPAEMVPQELKDQLVFKDHKVSLDHKENPEQMENMVNKEPKVNRVNKVSKENKVNAVLQDLLVQLDLLVLREKEEKLAQWDLLAHLANL
jgi:predicted RNA-binding protein